MKHTTKHTQHFAPDPFPFPPCLFPLSLFWRFITFPWLRTCVFFSSFPFSLPGEISAERLNVLREADAIFIEELRQAGLYRQIGQAFAVLLPCKTVGVMGDFRTYEEVIALRAVETTDYMTANWFNLPYDILQRVSTRIVNEIRGVNRVCYDITSKPPGTIEWE